MNVARENAIRLLEEASNLRSDYDTRKHARRIEEATVWANIYRADVIAGKG